VLVVTKIDERQAEPDQTGATRAIDILADRLPKVPSKPENAVKADASGAIAPGTVVPTTVAPTGSDAKPKAEPAEASAASGTPTAQKKAGPASSSGASSVTSSGPKATAAGTTTVKDSPRPVKATVEPKPQPAVEDSPH